jgi:double zinc ribbon protein
MTDVERFFRQIVRNLSAIDPSRLRRPLPLGELRDRIVPYRTNRRPLELESIEEYELVLMRLCAGEGGFAQTEPAEIRVEFEIEVAGSNPDLGLLRRHENAVVCLQPNSLARALDPRPDLAFAPPDQRIESVESFPSRLEAASRPAEEPAHSQCTHCQGRLPSDRAVNFCPHCGRSQALTRCPVCDGDVEAGWRHCVTCGYRISDG